MESSRSIEVPPESFELQDLVFQISSQRDLGSQRKVLNDIMSKYQVDGHVLWDEFHPNVMKRMDRDKFLQKMPESLKGLKAKRKARKTVIIAKPSSSTGIANVVFGQVNDNSCSQTSVVADSALAEPPSKKQKREQESAQNDEISALVQPLSQPIEEELKSLVHPRFNFYVYKYRSNHEFKTRMPFFLIEKQKLMNLDGGFVEENLTTEFKNSATGAFRLNRTDLKRAGVGRESSTIDLFKKPLCAFANTLGGICFGYIHDSGAVVGGLMSDSQWDSFKQDLDKWLLNLDRPVAPESVYVERIPVFTVDLIDTGKFVIVLRISKSESCHFFRGKLFVRGHASSQTLRGHAAVEYLLQRKQDSSNVTQGEQDAIAALVTIRS